MSGVPRLVLLDEVWAALAECLPGYSKRPTDHHWRITKPGSSTYGILPLGEHGRREHVFIEAGKVRQLCRLFEIGACMGRLLPCRAALADDPPVT